MELLKGGVGILRDGECDVTNTFGLLGFLICDDEGSLQWTDLTEHGLQVGCCRRVGKSRDEEGRVDLKLLVVAAIFALVGGFGGDSGIGNLELRGSHHLWGSLILLEISFRRHLDKIGGVAVNQKVREAEEWRGVEAGSAVRGTPQQQRAGQQRDSKGSSSASKAQKSQKISRRAQDQEENVLFRRHTQRASSEICSFSYHVPITGCNKHDLTRSVKSDVVAFSVLSEPITANSKQDVKVIGSS